MERGGKMILIHSSFPQHVPSYYVLMCGRVMGGIATSILFSAFESWLVCEHAKVCSSSSSFRFPLLIHAGMGWSVQCNCRSPLCTNLYKLSLNTLSIQVITVNLLPLHVVLSFPFCPGT